MIPILKIELRSGLLRLQHITCLVYWSIVYICVYYFTIYFVFFFCSIAAAIEQHNRRRWSIVKHCCQCVECSSNSIVVIVKGSRTTTDNELQFFVLFCSCCWRFVCLALFEEAALAAAGLLSNYVFFVQNTQINRNYFQPMIFIGYCRVVRNNSSIQ